MADGESKIGGVKTFEDRLEADPDLLYELGLELYHELNSHGFVERLSEIPHLGLIEVPEGTSMSRLDYIRVQLTLHRIVRKNIKLPDGRLDIGYNNEMSAADFRGDLDSSIVTQDFTVADCLQILCLACSLGHAYHTFVSSRALTMASVRSGQFRDLLLASCHSAHLKSLATRILEERNYHQVHLINSLIALDRCDPKKVSVNIAKALVFGYLNEGSMLAEDKRKKLINIFRTVRDVSFLANDLKIASMPLTINLEEEGPVATLLKELLCAYNDDTQPKRLVQALTKLLSDYVYNVEPRCINHYRIAQNMAGQLSDCARKPNIDYYQDIWRDKESCLNRKPATIKSFEEKEILKLTFPSKYREQAWRLLQGLEMMDFVRVGHYDRYRHLEEGTTLLISQRNLGSNNKIVSFSILKKVITHLLELKLDINHVGFLLSAKYFLYYLFNERKVEIQTPVDPTSGILCAPDQTTLIEVLERMLAKGKGEESERHEVEFLKSRLKEDAQNGPAIAIPSSIIIYGPDSKNLCELDGLIIYPYRKKDQIVFLEAKDTRCKPITAANELHESLGKIDFVVPKEDLISVGTDCYYPMTIE